VYCNVEDRRLIKALDLLPNTINRLIGNHLHGSESTASKCEKHFISHHYRPDVIPTLTSMNADFQEVEPCAYFGARICSSP